MGDFSIFLIYGGTRADDVIRIRPMLDKFRVNYLSRSTNVNHFMYCTNEQAFRYVDDLLYLLPPDAEPFSSVQFNFPCFPVVMYRLADLQNWAVRYTIRDRVAALLDNWPEARPLPTGQTAVLSLNELLSAYAATSDATLT